MCSDLAVGEEAPRHRLHVLLAHLPGHVAVVGQQELVVKPAEAFPLYRAYRFFGGLQG